MRNTAIDGVLDDALRLLAQGHDAEYCAKQFPQHTDQLYPLLLVMEGLLELRTDAELVLSNAGSAPRSFEWESLCEPEPVH